MLDLGALKIGIKVGKEEANNDLNEVGKKAEQTESKFKKLGENMKKGMLVATGAVAGAVTGLVVMANKSAETTDRIDKMSHKIGLTKTAFQEWDYILGQNGFDVEKLQTGMKTLTQHMDNAQKGTESAKEMFKELGLTWQDNNGKLKNQEQMLEESILALAQMENGTEKARLATELFGKAGIDMMPMLNGGAEAITELKDRAHELGLIMSDEAVDAGVIFGDSIDDLKDSFGAVFTKIGVQVIPIIQNLVNIILEHMPQIQAVLSTVFGVIGDVVSTAIDWIGKFIGWIKDLSKQAQTDGTEINKIFTQIKDIVIKAFTTIKDFLQAFFEWCKRFWNEYGENITAILKAIWDVILSVFKIAFDVIKDIFKIFTALFKGDWQGFWNGIKDLFVNLWNNISKFFENALKGFIILFKNIVPMMLNVGKDIMNGLWEGLKSIWKGITGWIGDSIKWLGDKLAFWKKGKNEMSEGNDISNTKVDGSHANGLNYVPYDNYIARLHEGERVLTAQEARNYNNNTNNSIVINATVREEADIQKISRELENMLYKNKRALGYV